jgi:hypothetical protein
MLRFVNAVGDHVTWRAVIVTQVLGALFAISPWLMLWHSKEQPPLSFLLTEEVLTALFMMLAAFAGNEAMRRGTGVFRAFVTVLLAASVLTAAMQWGVDKCFDVPDQMSDLQRFWDTFFNVGGNWGTVLMVYLNRESATRLLARVRGAQLAQVQTEQRLAGSRLASAETQIDPVSVFQKLGDVRDLYAAGKANADESLEALITDLRGIVRRSKVEELPVPAHRQATVGAGGFWR